MAGSLKPLNVRLYDHVMVASETSAVQFGLGQEKVARNSEELVPFTVTEGTESLPFLVGNNGIDDDALEDLLNGVTTLELPGLWQTPLNDDVTLATRVAFVLPTPAIAVPVQLNVAVAPSKVHTGSLEPFA
jgi:hypothetical protein